jgi:hypothetical protein
MPEGRVGRDRHMPPVTIYICLLGPQYVRLIQSGWDVGAEMQCHRWWGRVAGHTNTGALSPIPRAVIHHDLLADSYGLQGGDHEYGQSREGNELEGGLAIEYRRARSLL